MKKILFILAAGLFITAAALAGCGLNREPVTIRYAAWNLGDPKSNGLERQMVKSFMEEYPDIRVEIDESFAKNYDKALQNAANRKAMPDVFMYASNPEANSNGWCADLSGIVAKDREWPDIPAPLRQAAKIKGKTIAVPCSMYLFGYFCNDTLIQRMQATKPEPGFTIPQFIDVIEKSTDANRKSIGIADESSVIEWYPAAADPLLQWYTWDGGKFNLDSNEFRDGIKLACSINRSHQTFASLTHEEKKKIGFANDWEAWRGGAVAMKFDGTWMVSDYSKLPFKVSFAGIPGGRICLVPDFMFVSSQSRHPREAYQFIKFMSAYSREGFAKRMELGRQNGLTVSTIPMTSDKKLLDAYFSSVKMDGLREVYDAIGRNSYVEGTKILPGYSQARWQYATSIAVGSTQNAKIGDVIKATYRGDLDIDDIASELNSDANECVMIFPRSMEN